MAFSPVTASKDITDKYRRYLSTIFSFKDTNYQHQFESALRALRFSNGPFLDITDAFEIGETIRQLIECNELPRGFERLHFHVDRPLYSHQVDALRSASRGNNLVVSTGTGSGKTESFLLPIMRELVLEYNAGTLTPGVRAMLIYPMNALANDQVERLRELLSDFPEITFGSYTGQTRESYKDAVEEYKKLNRGSLPKENELISREQMKKTPPHILITNYAMLEYLMVRPDDSVFFQDNYTEHWKFIVLDEAHVYRGSTGIEVSMLLRRLRARLGKKNIQYILTSATLGGEDDNASVAQFGKNLCDADFRADNVIRAKRIKVSRPDDCISPPRGFYSELSSAIKEDLSDYELNSIVHTYYPAANADIHEALYDIILKDPLYWDLRRLLRTPQNIRAILNQSGISEQELTDFVNVATRAVHDGGKLFDARYHLFLKAAESVYITLAPSKKVFLEARKTYLDGNISFKVFEVATCIHCHAAFILGKESGQHILEQENYLPDQEPRATYLIADNISDSDDEHSLEDEGEETEEYELCAVCGMIKKKGSKRGCEHDNSYIRTVHKVALKEGRGILTKCPCCESVSSTGILRRFFTGQEAATSVIGTSLFEDLPSYSVSYDDHAQEDDSGFDDGWETEENTLRKTAVAKQFIAFSDSRQAAAYYATYLDQTYTNILYKRLVIETIQARQEPLSVTEFVKVLAGNFDKYGIVSKETAEREAWKAILHELMTNNANTSLYNLGLISFDVICPELRNPKFHLDAEEIHEIVSLFSEWMMSEGAVSHPAFAYEERLSYIPSGIENSYTLSDADSKKHTLSFLPSKADRTNKRLDYLSRVIERKHISYTQEAVSKLAEGLWTRMFVKPSDGCMCLDNNRYLLSPNRILIGRPQKLYICRKCHKITTHNVADVCPMYKCDGTLEAFDVEHAYKDNHYYRLYQDIEIRPLRVVEHTAQLSRDQAYDFQVAFKEKKIDILSCSTTFEMGVDVGSLETVFMRNVPPSPANYAQRAGRAGRSLTSAAFALTFCNKSNHDFTFFNDPVRMIKGRIDPPVFNTDNSKIGIRHVYASAFSFFWKQYPQYFRQSSDFFEPDQTGKSGFDVLKNYLSSRPEELRIFLFGFLPARLSEQFDVENFGWVNELIGADGSLTRAFEMYQNEVSILENEKNRLFNEGKRGVDNLIQRIAVYKKENVLAYLARKNVFPRYGFPVDTVEMLMYSREGNKSAGLQLSRDLAVAISEYAPGSQVVANGNLITSRYIRKMPGRSWKMACYCMCENCKSMNIKPYLPSDEEKYDRCEVCGDELNRHFAGKYLIPEWGFEADGNKITRPGLRKPQRTYSGEAAYIGMGSEDSTRIFKIGNATISARSGSSEEMAIINRNRFYVCECCGYTELDEKDFRNTKKKKHTRLTGGECINGRLNNYSLAYRFMTDIVELHFENPEIRESDQALSLLYAIINGVCRALNIEQNDISGCLRWFRNKDSGYSNFGFILYDKTPGGAGHVKRLLNETVLESVLRETLALVENCSCGGEAMDTSCYSCLQNYYNQRYHDRLQRGYVVNYLRSILNQQ